MSVSPQYALTPAQRFQQRLNGIEAALQLLIKQVQDLRSLNYEDLPEMPEIKDIGKAFPKDF